MTCPPHEVAEDDTCSLCGEERCPRCLGEGRELSGPPGWYVLSSPCRLCGGEGTDPGEDERWLPW